MHEGWTQRQKIDQSLHGVEKEMGINNNGCEESYCGDVNDLKLTR